MHGILLQLKDGRLVLTIYEDDAKPVETISNTDLLSRTFSDNKLHSVYFLKGVNSIKVKVDNEIMVDSVFVSKFHEQKEKISLNALIVGGMPNDENTILNTEDVNNFEGCITQVRYKQQQKNRA